MSGPRDRISNETDLIQTYLAPLTQDAPGAFGLRDDAALITPEPGTDLVFSSDPIIAGVHFLATDKPSDVAWKALAVNASDLAAKGAKPTAYILNLAFPERPEREWMRNFSEGLQTAQQSFGCHLIGGDTDVTPGPLSIGVTIIGAVPSGRFIRRQGAASGDHVFVTGTIGDSALGLRLHTDPSAWTALASDDRAFLTDRYLRPAPRLGLRDALRANASAALDVSDGFLKDLSRLAGPLGLRVAFDRIPVSKAAAAVLAHDAHARDLVLGGGDDYELLIAVPPARMSAFRADAEASGIAVTDLGTFAVDTPIEIVDRDGARIEAPRLGYDHFSR